MMIPSIGTRGICSGPGLARNFTFAQPAWSTLRRARGQVGVVLDGAHQSAGAHGAHEPGDVVAGPAGDVADAVAVPKCEQPDGAFEIGSAGGSDEPVAQTVAPAAVGAGRVCGLHLIPS